MQEMDVFATEATSVIGPLLTSDGAHADALLGAINEKLIQLVSVTRVSQNSSQRKNSKILLSVRRTLTTSEGPTW